MADYTLNGYTGAALEAQLAKINTQGAKLDTIEEGANKYILPTATRSQLGGIIAYATATTMPVYYGRVYVNSNTGMPYVPLATSSVAGALSPTDYTKLSKIWPDASNIINKVETIKVDGTTLTPDSSKAVDIDLSGKVDNDDIYKNVKASAEWSQNYVMTDRTNVGKPFLQYQFDTDNSTLDIGWLTAVGYAYTVRIPLVDDTHNAFFDPYYYSEFIQPLFNGEFAYKGEVDEVKATADAAKAKAEANASSISDAKQVTGWVSKYIQQGDAEHPFLQGRQTDSTYNIGWMIDGWTYRENVQIPLISEDDKGLMVRYCWENLLPYMNGEAEDRISALEAKVNELINLLNKQTLITK